MDSADADRAALPSRDGAGCKRRTRASSPVGCCCDIGQQREIEMLGSPYDEKLVLLFMAMLCLRTTQRCRIPVGKYGTEREY